MRALLTAAGLLALTACSTEAPAAPQAVCGSPPWDTATVFPFGFPVLEETYWYAHSRAGVAATELGHHAGGPADVVANRDRVVTQLQAAGYALLGEQTTPGVSATAHLRVTDLRGTDVRLVDITVEPAPDCLGGSGLRIVVGLRS